MLSPSRIFTVPNHARSSILKVHDGDTVLVRDGYHPVITQSGYDVSYYLNFLAGTSRSMMVTGEDRRACLASARSGNSRTLVFPMVGAGKRNKRL